MIWTQEESDLRELDNMITHTDETCKSCQWSNHSKGEKYFTCGHHLSNFTHDSWCSYWTAKDNPKVKAYYAKRREELKAKITKIC